ncbi:MAG: hypothetical protein K0Q51_1310 [Rickettsiaceae bacterium]|jgi:hypothetical protein|nr:hypothetical protein [Rickettsiaceae bacterium]
MQAKIYKPIKSAMQSGVANTEKWILDFVQQEGSRFIEHILGWTASKDMNQEIRLSFNNKEEAISFANKHNLDYEVIEPQQRKVIKKSYADNFR